MSEDRSTDNTRLLILAVVSLAIALGIFQLASLGLVEHDAAPILALCALPWFTVFFCVRPLPLVLMWPIALLYDEIIHDALSMYPTLAQLGRVQLLPLDIPYFFTLTYLLYIAAARPREIKRVARDYPFLTLFIIIIMASVIIYTPEYGKMAIGEARRFFFYFFFPFLAVTSIKRFANLHRLLLAVFFVAIGISALGYTLLLIGPSAVRSSLRPISADGALILLFTIFSVLIARSNNTAIVNRTIDSIMIGVSFPLVIIPHHRTVFLAAFAGLFLLIGLRKRKVAFVLKLILAAVLICGSLGAVFIMVPRFESILSSAIRGIVDPHSDANASWRLEGWQKQLASLSGTELLFGQGLGDYYNWDIRNQKITAEPHDVYVQVVLKFGLFGLVVYALLTFHFFRKMLLTRRHLPAGPAKAYIEMGIVNVCATHAFMTGYDFSLIMFIFYAIGLTATKLLEGRSEVVEPVRGPFNEMSRRTLVSQSV